MDVGAAVVADEQTPELVQPGERPLDHPAKAAETGAMLGRAAGDHRFDPSLPELAPVASRVVGAIGDELLGPTAGSADAAAHLWHPVDERDQLGDVVAVDEREGERDPALVDEEMVFGAQPSAVNRARARRATPFFACTWLESATARVHSICPAARNRSNNPPCSRSHTPARCHSSSRRQQVTPEPKPSSWGRCRQAIPVWSTNKIPDSVARSGWRLRPPGRDRFRFGNNGSISSHSSSDTVHGAAAIGIPLPA